MKNNEHPFGLAAAGALNNTQTLIGNHSVGLSKINHDIKKLDYLFGKKPYIKMVWL